MANLEQLRSTQSTPLLTPDDAGYAEAVRLWGAPASPDVLVRPTTEEEVGAALVWAAAEGVEVGVRSGAHGPLDAPARRTAGRPRRLRPGRRR